MHFKKKLGFVLLGIVVFCWVAVPILPFFTFPYKVIVISSLLVGGEVLFVITIALLGKEYWGKIKTTLLNYFKRKNKPNRETNQSENGAEN